jgi:hypothetical protein
MRAGFFFQARPLPPGNEGTRASLSAVMSHEEVEIATMQTRTPGGLTISAMRFLND